MKRLLTAFMSLLCVQLLHSQLLTWTPGFPKENDNITITIDATRGNQGLNNYADPNDVYVHIGLITSASAHSTDWKHAAFIWPGTDPASKAVSLTNNKYSFTINNGIRSFFKVPAGETIYKIAILFRNGSGQLKQANADGSDMYIPVYDNSVAVRFTTPVFQPKYIPEPETISTAVGDNISLTAISSKAATLNLYLGENLISTAANATTISANPLITAGGNTIIVVEAIEGTTIKKDSVKFFVAAGINVAPLPVGVKEGINYHANNTELTLALYAPSKNRVSVIGELAGNNWTEQSQYQMNKTPDGNYWWLKFSGLTPGLEYIFQYLVDGTLRVADPYSEKVLSPDDQYINTATYPNLKPYPTNHTTGNVTVIQTNELAYNWQVNSFAKPDKRNLIIYELLLRDFTDAHNWQTMIDTLSYLQRLGINAIELMPVNEFEGNDSWGYNPSFYFAPDKYYGTKNKLKEFIDSCHKKQIAVILDLVPNHSYGQSPLAQLYWNSSSNRPAANSPWFNEVQPHAFGFGQDFNHEKTATKYYWQRIFDHWLREYRIDGYRLDFTKGLTQKSSANDGQFSAYDQTRIDILKRYADSMIKYFPDTYLILEHLAAKDEEQVLQNLGFLLWSGAGLNRAYNEATMGYHTNSNISSIVYNSNERGFTQPYLVGYMESHDEERLMYKNLAFGNSSGSYNVKNEATALQRMEAAAALFYTIPGPKMIWQFGERGYDKSIFACTDNTIPQPYGTDNCKLSPKESRWQYMQQEGRKKLFEVNASLINLRKTQPALFNSTSFEYNLVNAVKHFKITEPALSALVVANFDVIPATAVVSFQNAGAWYDYLTGETIIATGAVQNITLQPGEYHVYVNKNIGKPTTPVVDIDSLPLTLTAKVFPNPLQTGSKLEIEIPEGGKTQVILINAVGQQIQTIFSGVLAKGKHHLSLTDKINNLPAGLYLVKLQSDKQTGLVKIMIP